MKTSVNFNFNRGLALIGFRTTGPIATLQRGFAPFLSRDNQVTFPHSALRLGEKMKNDGFKHEVSFSCDFLTLSRLKFVL